MALIKSISGIRGTIGGKPGEGLTPVDIVKFSAAYGTWLIDSSGKKNATVVVGRDARRSGSMVSSMVISTLQCLGISVTDIGLASTPTVEIAVTGLKAEGGIIITASHNPAEWNALKLLNSSGEFLSAAEGSRILEIAAEESFLFVNDESRGKVSVDDTWTKKHIDMILSLRNVDVKTIKAAGFSIAIDCINSVGGIIVPELLQALGVQRVTGLNTIPDGNFTHNPEPLPDNLRDISELVVRSGADLGFVVDPDVDRLAIISEDGTMFGEEYTLVSVADYVLKDTPGSTVSNMSSTRALKDVSAKHGCIHYSSAVGEVNVVEEMKRRDAVIGGEGNGGIIYPEIHYGRDALVGIALFLSHLSKSGLKCSTLRNSYPDYFMAKKKMTLSPDSDFKEIVEKVKKYFKEGTIDERDGLWVGLKEGWVQIRKSNTEPIMRIYSEAKTHSEAERLADAVISIVKKE